MKKPPRAVAVSPPLDVESAGLRSPKKEQRGAMGWNCGRRIIDHNRLATCVGGIHRGNQAMALPSRPRYHPDALCRRLGAKALANQHCFGTPLT